jgi:hypothetical protein
MLGVGRTSGGQLQHMSHTTSRGRTHTYVLSRRFYEMGQGLLLLNAAELYELAVHPAGIRFARRIQS